MRRETSVGSTALLCGRRIGAFPEQAERAFAEALPKKWNKTPTKKGVRTHSFSVCISVELSPSRQFAVQNLLDRDAAEVFFQHLLRGGIEPRDGFLLLGILARIDGGKPIEPDGVLRTANDIQEGDRAQRARKRIAAVGTFIGTNKPAVLELAKNFPGMFVRGLRAGTVRFLRLTRGTLRLRRGVCTGRFTGRASG